MRNHFVFAGADRGDWRVLRQRAVSGDALPPAPRVAILDGTTPPPGAAWALRGFTSNIRYATTAELDRLAAVQQGLGRPAATLAALIPIRKSAAWWALGQDARRAIFEETSHHTAIGLDYLPPVARRLHHCRDLGEPFDFLTWFEFAPEHAAGFDALLARLRASAEWRYVEHEVELRLVREPG